MGKFDILNRLKSACIQCKEIWICNAICFHEKVFKGTIIVVNFATNDFDLILLYSLFRSGEVDPLTLDIKMDKKGLMAAEEDLKKRRKGGDDVISMTGCKDLSHKHPVSALMELSTKRMFKNYTFICKLLKVTFYWKAFMMFHQKLKLR